MADEIEIGSIVRLKSGGPNMTVEAIFSDHEGVWVRCSWSDDTKRISRTFPIVPLPVEIDAAGAVD